MQREIHATVDVIVEWLDHMTHSLTVVYSTSIITRW